MCSASSSQTLNFAGRMFDVVLLWTSLDYLPEPFVKPVVDHLYASMNPGGQVLALFHTRTQGEETVHCRFHVTPGNDIEVQLGEAFPIQRSLHQPQHRAALRRLERPQAVPGQGCPV